ncbi:MAG: S8 family serine peptidase [Bacillota bacterium]|nr:S8 family serine peptidase [Bacillota bacterium]
MKLNKLLASVLSASILLSAASMNVSTFAAGNVSRNNFHKVYLKTSILDHGKLSLAKQGTANDISGNQERPYLISFTGPITDEMKSSVTSLGVKLLDYIPDFSFLSNLTPDIAEKVKKISCVEDVLPYESQYKIDPALMAKISKNDEKKAGKVDKELQVRISAFGDDNSQLNSEIDQIGVTKIRSGKGSLVAKVKYSQIESLSKMKSVKFIEEAPEFKLNNDVASGIVGAELASSYGYEGAGQIVGVADSGLDKGTTGISDGTIHADFKGRVDNIFDLIGTTTGIDENGHGTHVAGSIIGNGQMSNGKIKGIAPKAHLVVQKIGDSNGFVHPGNLSDLFLQAYNNGVRIHSDSWGNSALGTYQSDCADTDNFIWSHKDMIIVASAGNEGPSTCTINSPGAAKNCITVGAVENYRPYMKLYQGSSVSDNPDESVFFSSRGCVDGRIKPDVVAPGTYIASTLSSAALTIEKAYPGNPYYQYMSGTSMAAPITSGSVAVVREYITKNYNITPSAALLKAFIINGALGQSGNTEDKGWGKVSLYDSLFATHIINDTAALTTGNSLSYSVPCTKTDRPLKVSLVWSDYPAAPLSAHALVNDLDLKVTSPDGSVSYYGNNFTSPYNSNFDRTNNVENVIINNPVAGNYKVEVIGYNIPYGPQPFALVSSDDFFSAPKNLKATATSNSITVNWDTVPGATGYDVEVDGTTVTAVTGTNYTINNLAYNTVHKFRVRAKNAQTVGSWSYTLSQSALLTTPVVTGTLGKGGIQISWNAVSQATSYDVYLNNTCVASTTSTNYSYTALAPKSTYNFFVRAISDFNCSLSSNTLQFNAPDIGLFYGASMASQRMDFASAASKNGKIYAAGGKSGSLYLKTVEEYDPTKDVWTAKAPMSHERSGFKMIEADNGKIYAIGGFDGTSYLNTVEEYDPATNTWAIKANMPTARSGLGIANVNGKIYAIGGYNGTSTLRTVEAYDPLTNTWTSVSNMPNARSNFGNGVVSGKIIVMGGICGIDNLKAVEEYDPITAKWSIRKNLNDWNSDFSVSEVNGKLYISGGKNLNKIEEYDPTTSMEVVRTELPTNIYGHASAVQNGNLYIFGGYVNSASSNMCISYLPLKDDWLQSPSMINERAFFTSEVYNGKIYNFGGENVNFDAVNTVEEYDPSTGKWTSCPGLSSIRARLASGVINDKIYICGGTDTSSKHPFSSALEAYDPVNKTWTQEAAMPEGISEHKAVSLNGCLYVVGGMRNTGTDSNGYNINDYSSNVYKYDPVSNRWSTVAPLTIPRINHSLVTVNGKIYVIGGSNANGVIDSIQQYDPMTNTWTDKKPMPQKYCQFSTAVVNDKIYIMGGSDFAKDLNAVQVYDPATETWTVKQSLPINMARNCSVFTGNKIYCMGSMVDKGDYIDVLNTVYSYSPSDSDIIRLTMGNGVMEPKAGSKVIPLTISNVPSSGIYKGVISLKYDPATLKVTSITQGTSIPDSTGFSYSINNSLGTINISYTSSIKAITTGGIFANVEYDVLESVAKVGSSSLVLDKNASKFYDASSLEYQGSKLFDGIIDIIKYGDVNSDSAINSADNSYMGRFVLTTITNLPGNYAALCGDVDGNGVINSADQSWIKRYVTGEVVKFPVQIQ